VWEEMLEGGHSCLCCSLLGGRDPSRMRTLDDVDDHPRAAVGLQFAGNGLLCAGQSGVSRAALAIG